ncbi:hypothetical protein [Streptomyces sp. NPDC059564]|uniref:hypothetical protein n=1 Tax=Streptomyces sp. NPDC059564 TaxID=3346865 RepID=UPI003676C6D2
MIDMQTWRDSWTRATNATEAIRAALTALGIPEAAWSTVLPVVTHSGQAYVNLGMIRAEAAEQLAEALRSPAESCSPTCRR